ncbi:MAG: OadG-related small transporter subunit [Bacillota bacterium]
MTDMQFGLTLMVFGGGLTLMSLGLIVIAITILVKLQPQKKGDTSTG